MTKKSSKVMTIANRLVSQGCNRSKAMIKAWILVKAEQVSIKIAGTSFYNRQKALEHLKRYNKRTYL